MMLTIYLARHGQDEDNANGILNGRRDTPLTTKGFKQAQQVADEIADMGLHFDAIYASPLQRAYTTAETIARTSHQKQPKKLPDLIERDFGIMSGKPIVQIEKLCAPDILKTDTVTYFLSPEGAETFPDLLARAQETLQYVRDNHHDGNILLVGHGDFGKMLYCAYYNLDWKDVLRTFHFGNSELLIMSPESSPEDVHVFQNKQHNL